MLSVWVTSFSNAALTPTAIALGNFDGLHLGHRQVVLPILQRAGIPDSLTASPEGSKDGAIYGTVVTFRPHPQEFFSGQPKKLLTPLREKVALLRSMGVDQLVLLPFNRELAALTPDEFVAKILVRQLQAHRISVGCDFHFGARRAGTANDLAAIAANYGIDVTVVPLYTDSGERISSSAIRTFLQNGDLQQANKFLGRPYSLSGVVVQGQQLGRKIGFPTANLQLPPEKFLPRFGVYAVRIAIEPNTGEEFSHTGTFNLRPETINPMPKNVYPPILGVMNIGCRPTVAGENPTVEVHLFDWTEDLYGKILTANLEHFLRPEQKFPSLEALKEQIHNDCVFARNLMMG
ncbi:riboflavin biosynthesis protein RibF [Oscillatoriales cyanobacterium USR001]|nr:riboflavin biosynthesis protein RibF [Oscillatoriales cyanobacterium USR001]